MMLELGYPGFDHLSAAAFQKGSMPDLDDAIRLGRSERLAMVAADSGGLAIEESLRWLRLYSKLRTVSYASQKILDLI
jgi:hypothetical protein